MTEFKREITRDSYLSFLFFLLLHVACFAALWTGVSAEALLLCAALYLLRMFGITAGFHRYFSHRAFRTGRVFQFVLAVLGQASFQRGVIWWAAKHREHHRDSDLPADVHSPVQHGFWFSHCGWIFNDDAIATDYGKVPDLTRYPELVWLDRNQYLPGLLLALACWLAMGWQGLVVGFFWSTVLLFHATFAINSLAHVLGRARYLTGDESKNNFWLALLTLGEGWHNNHHYFMASARQGFRWWEVDISYYVLRGLAALGVVSDLKEPPARIVAGGREISEPLRDRLAVLVATRFDVDGIAARVRARIDALESGELAERLRAEIHAELPAMEELRERARKLFAPIGDALHDIAERARQRLADAVQQSLMVSEPVPA